MNIDFFKTTYYTDITHNYEVLNEHTSAKHTCKFSSLLITVYIYIQIILEIIFLLTTWIFWMNKIKCLSLHHLYWNNVKVNHIQIFIFTFLLLDYKGVQPWALETTRETFANLGDKVLNTYICALLNSDVSCTWMHLNLSGIRKLMRTIKVWSLAYYSFTCTKWLGDKL